MKSILPFLLFLFSAASLAAQQRADQQQGTLSKEYYVHLSKKQKLQANILVITGSATALIGSYIWVASPIAGISGSSQGVASARRTGITLTAAGASLAAISIPLYIASKKNLKNAELYVGSSSLQYPTTTQKDFLCIGARIDL